MKKPDLEVLQKFNEDKKLSTWEKYLVKAKNMQKYLRKHEKEQIKKMEEKRAIE